MTLPSWDWTADAGAAAPAARARAARAAGGRRRGRRRRRRLRPYLTLLVWLDASEVVRRGRALARDGDTYAPHWERWAWQERAHFAREGTAGRADVRVGTGR